MVQTLYKSRVQAVQVERVLREVQYGLAESAREMTVAPERHLSLAPETIAGTAALYSYADVHYRMRLRQRAVELVEEPCREHGITVQLLGEYPLFRQIKLVRGSVSDVAIVPADLDPLYMNGKFSLPRHVYQRMKAIGQAGVPTELLYTYIAHEVPCGSVSEYGPLPLDVVQPPLPAAQQRVAQTLGHVAHTCTRLITDGLLRTGKSSLYGVGLVGAGASAVAAVLLDPLIFGAIADEHGMATWFLLAQWYW